MTTTMATTGDKTDDAGVTAFAGHAEVMMARVDLPLFKAFVRHREPFEIMVRAEVFELAHGKAVLNFHDGRLQSVVIERRTYQHRAL